MAPLGYEPRDLAWIRNASQVCRVQECQHALAANAIAVAQRMGEAVRMIENEDIALWCGVGGHAFSSRDPGRQRVTVQQWDEEANEMRPVAASACGEHARPLQIQTRPKAITNGNGSVTDPGEARARGYDPDYVAWLEKQAAAASAAPDPAPWRPVPDAPQA